MESCTMLQWMTFFYFYSFVGWIWETCYVSAKKGHFVDRGFLHGPVLPIYGSGAVMLLVVSLPFRENYILTFLAGMVGATILEYVTGWAMEKLFKVRYWDYSYYRFQLNGHICLVSSIAWGFFTIIMTKWIHPPVYELITGKLNVTVNFIAVFVITIIFVIDIYQSAKAAFDMASALETMEKIRGELDDIQVQKALLKKEAEEYLHENLGDLIERVDEIKIKIMNIHEDNVQKAAERKQNMIEKMEYLKRLNVRRDELRGSKEETFKRLTNEQIKLILRNPSAKTSGRLETSFKELKEKIVKKNESDKAKLSE